MAEAMRKVAAPQKKSKGREGKGKSRERGKSGKVYMWYYSI
jgi:hypothetical protein